MSVYYLNWKNSFSASNSRNERPVYSHTGSKLHVFLSMSMLNVQHKVS